MVKLFSIFLFFLLLFNACSSKKQIAQPASVNEILKNQENAEYKSINVTELKKSISVILDDDRLKFISPLEKYYTYPIAEDEYVIYISEEGYDTTINRYTEQMCGSGNTLGFFNVLNPKKSMEIIERKNQDFCSHKFTSASDYLIGDRIASGIITFGTSIVTAADSHKKSFDSELFKDSIIDSKLYMAKDKIINKFNSYDIKYGLDVIYVDTDDLEDSFDDAFDDLVTYTHKRDGLVIMDEDSKKLLSIVVFEQNVPITKAITKALAQISQDITNSNFKEIKKEDVQKYIPSKIKKPQLPKIVKLHKDEFETKKQFEKRVEEAVYQREEEIRKIQREYELEVQRRNNYIYSLENSFNTYNKELDEKKTKLYNNFLLKSDKLAKLLFLERLSGYNAVDFNYDAELQRLYFNILANNADINNHSFIKIKPQYAKEIKYEHDFNIIPQIVSSNKQLKLEKIFLLYDGDKYEVQYTNINYKPEVVYTTIQKADEKIVGAYNNTFKSSIQKPLALLDYKEKEVWYIDVAQRFNAKVPTWFQKTLTTDKGVIGYGTGDSLESAMLKARTEIAFMLSSNVNSQMFNEENIDSYNSNYSFKTQTKISSDVELDKQNVKVLKQEQVDGKWYVALNYNSVK